MISIPRFLPSLFAAVCLLLLSVCYVSAVWAQAALGNPQPGSFQSGVGMISGWVCEAEQIDIVFNPGTATEETWRAGYRTTREDTEYTPEGEVLCGDTDNGFGLLFNWNRLGDGVHTVRALADGVEFGRATFTVTTLGEEFRRGLSREVVVSDFPEVGAATTLVWQESLQNFMIQGDMRSSGGTSGAPPRMLGNPQPGSFQSGVGVISGWVCEAERIDIVFNPGTATEETWRAGYRTTREDTESVCNDIDNGFGLLFNWNRLGDGVHTVRALADGVEFGRATVIVTTLGEETRKGLSREVVVSDFPEVGDATTLVWQESQQNFVIAGSTAGPVLSIEAPDPVPGFFADVSGLLHPVVRYTGEAPLSFTLPTAPPGMEIDARSGTIVWTPPASATGNTFDVTVEVESRDLFDRVAFQVSVLEATALQTTVVNGELTVTDGRTDLHGLRITTPGTDLSLSDLRLETVEREAVLATVPADLILLSDFFVIREPFTQPVELTFVVGDLPEGTTIQDVDLYTFSGETLGDEPFWGPILVEWGYEMIDGAPAYIVSLEGLQGLFVFGLSEFVPGEQATSSAAPAGGWSLAAPAMSRSVATAQSVAATQVSANKVNCFPVFLPSLLDLSPWRSQVCKYSDDPDVTIWVKDFGWLPNSERWGVKIEEFVTWVIEVQKKLDEYKLTYNKHIAINFAFITRGDATGYVMCTPFGFGLDAGLINIVPRKIGKAKAKAQGTLAHEYFHHAQCHGDNKIEGMDLVLRRATDYDWLTEGSADWFARKMLPGYSRNIGVNILEGGLNATPALAARTFSYLRDAFSLC